MFTRTKAAISAFVVIGLCSLASAGTINVSPGQSIQAAINAANNGDEVVVAPGTYNEAINFNGKAITVRSSGGPDVTVLDGTGLDTSVVTFDSGETSTSSLRGLTITGGEGTVIGVNRHGGGILNYLSSPVVDNCRVFGNMAQLGGGVANYSSNALLINCVIDGNVATFGSGTSGGAGVYNFAGNPILSGTRIEDNYAVVWGGGILSISSNAAITNCSLINNYGLEGGGIFNSGTIELSACTLTLNSAQRGGALSCVASSGTAVTVIANSILFGNDSDEGTSDEINYGLNGVVSATYSNITGGWPGVGNISVDPIFVNPAAGDVRLSPGSPCIDAASNNALPVGTTEDMEGNPRFVDDPNTPDSGQGQNPVTDMGACEFQASPPVDTCPEDTNGDDIVDVQDLIAVILAWGTTDPSADVNDDGIVNVVDLVLTTLNWGTCP